MGIIHSRAAKKRNKAEAAQLREQTREMKADHRADAASRHIDAYFDGTLPKWRLIAGELLTVRKMEKARDVAEGS
jgi:hypothetical protein